MKAIIISEVALDAIIKQTIEEMAESWRQTDADAKFPDDEAQSVFRGNPHRAAVYHLEGMKKKLIEG